MDLSKCQNLSHEGCAYLVIHNQVFFMKYILFPTSTLVIGFSACIVALLASSCTNQPTSTSNNPSPAPAIASSSPTAQVSPAQTLSPGTASKAASQPAVASSAPNVPCEFSAYVIDKDPNGLNVRSGPGSNYPVIGKLDNPDQGVVVEIAACQGEWVQIAKVDGGDNSKFQGKGWVYASLLGTSTRGYETQGVFLYTKADKNSKTLSKLPPERTVKLLGGSGQWMQVEYQGVRGWLAPGDDCPLPGTTCS